MPGDLDSTRNKLAGAKADLDYALAQRNSYGNVRYGGTRKTRAQYEKWSAEVRRAQAEVTRLENELKTERGGEIRYLAKKSTTDGALPENTPTSDDIQALRDIAVEYKAKGETTRVNINDFTSDDVRRTEVWARRFWAQLKEKSPFFRAWFGDWRAYDTKHKVSVVKKVPRTIGAELTVQEVAKKVREKYKSGDLFRGNVKNNDTGFVINVGAHGHNDTTTYAQRELRKKDVTKEEFLRRVNLLNSIQDLIKNSILLDTEIIDDPDNPNRSFMHTFYAIAEIDGYVEIVKLKVDEVEDSKNPTKRFYNLNDIQINNPSAVNWDSNPSTDADGMSDNLPDKLSIADLHALVKKYDPEFNPRPVNPVFRNKHGTPKEYYHGTPNGTFTEFRKWQYFTENKEYADVYQNQGASSNGYKPTAAAPTTYTVFLTGKKVFDTRNKAERTIFEQEFYGKWGNGAPLSDIGLPDWTDGDDLIEFFEENGYDYDTILLDEGGTGGYGDEVKSRGISVVVRNPSQIKSATDNIGTFDRSSNDIRYLAAKKLQESDAPDLRRQTAETITIKTREGKATVNAVNVMDTLAQIEMDDKRNGTDNLRTATAEIRRIQQMQKAFGLKVVFCDGTITFAKKSMGTQTFDGGMWHNGVVYVNAANIGQSSVFVAAHELGHEISENDPELLREFHDLCLEYAKRTAKCIRQC